MLGWGGLPEFTLAAFWGQLSGGGTCPSEPRLLALPGPEPPTAQGRGQPTGWAQLQPKSQRLSAVLGGGGVPVFNEVVAMRLEDISLSQSGLSWTVKSTVWEAGLGDTPLASILDGTSHGVGEALGAGMPREFPLVLKEGGPFVPATHPCTP